VETAGEDRRRERRWISERIKALKVKAQERYRGETNPAGGRDGLRAGSLKAWKR
jgi:hypothetical protein